MISLWPWRNSHMEQSPTDVIMCIWVGFWPIYWKCWSNNIVSTILRSFDLAMTLTWPHHDLGITPLWNPTPTHVTMCTWLEFRPIYFYTTSRVKGTLLLWPLVTLSVHRKSADHLKVTWYIIMLKKNMVFKSTRGGGGGDCTDGPKVYMYFALWVRGSPSIGLEIGPATTLPLTQTCNLAFSTHRYRSGQPPLHISEVRMVN